VLNFLDSLRVRLIGEFVEFQELTQDAVHTYLCTDYLELRANEEINEANNWIISYFWNIIENFT